MISHVRLCVGNLRLYLFLFVCMKLNDTCIIYSLWISSSWCLGCVGFALIPAIPCFVCVELWIWPHTMSRLFFCTPHLTTCFIGWTSFTFCTFVFQCIHNTFVYFIFGFAFHSVFWTQAFTAHTPLSFILFWNWAALSTFLHHVYTCLHSVPIYFTFSFYSCTAMFFIPSLSFFLIKF